jgi:hypothetical protein
MPSYLGTRSGTPHSHLILANFEKINIFPLVGADLRNKAKIMAGKIFPEVSILPGKINGK